VEVRIAGQEATLARPGDGNHWPAVVFVNGATELGHLAARRLSPVSHLVRLDAPVLLATSPNDKYFPVAESRRLASRSDHVRVTVTSSLSHAIPELSLGGIGDAFAFNGFVVRGLRAFRR
jgi:hypothetical protein